MRRPTTVQEASVQDSGTGVVVMRELPCAERAIPPDSGVFCVMRQDLGPPRFVSGSPYELRDLWVPETTLLGVRMAPGMTRAGTLRALIARLVQDDSPFGIRLRALACIDELVVAWASTPHPRKLLYALMKAFVLRHGTLPFLNRARPGPRER